MHNSLQYCDESLRPIPRSSRRSAAFKSITLQYCHSNAPQCTAHVTIGIGRIATCSALVQCRDGTLLVPFCHYRSEWHGRHMRSAEKSALNTPDAGLSIDAVMESTGKNCSTVHCTGRLNSQRPAWSQHYFKHALNHWCRGFRHVWQPATECWLFQKSFWPKSAGGKSVDERLLLQFEGHTQLARSQCARAGALHQAWPRGYVICMICMVVRP